jgi:hypothetical protein
MCIGLLSDPLGAEHYLQAEQIRPFFHDLAPSSEVADRLGTAGLDQLAEPPRLLIDVDVDHGPEQLRLGREVMQNAGVGDAHLGGDGGDRRASVAPVGQSFVTLGGSPSVDQSTRLAGRRSTTPS